MAVLFLALSLLMPDASAQYRPTRGPTLSQDRFKSGATTLQAFAPLAQATRDSIVQLDVDDKTVALGTAIDAHGLIITKSSEIKAGKLTGTLANGTQVEAELVARDEENDVALVKVNAGGLKPIEWASEDAFVGQWVLTPGIETTPEAVGIISVPPRKILPKRAYIGVVLDFTASTAKITEISKGLGAERAGLKPGDVILAVNETPVGNNEELTKTLRQFREGHTVKLRVRRGEEEFSVGVQMMMPKSDRTGRGFDRQERMNRLGGELSERAEGFELAIQHDTVLQPWQCGGPLVNLDGKAIGLNIARAGRVASYALPAALVKQILESWMNR